MKKINNEKNFLFLNNPRRKSCRHYFISEKILNIFFTHLTILELLYY